MVKKADVIIVLGRELNDDGTMPRVLQDRVKKGVGLWKRGLAEHVLMTGSSSGMKGRKKGKSEAEVMKKYAEGLGVAPRAIIKEEKSKDTIGNAYFSKAILKRKKWKSVIVVSSKHHFPRARIVFEQILGPNFEVQTVSSSRLMLHHYLRYLFQLFVNDLELVLTKQFFSGVKPGDDKAIKKRLLSWHPYYKREKK